MSQDGQTALQQFSQKLLTAFLRSFDDRKTVEIAELPGLAQRFLASPAAYVLLNGSYQQLHQLSSADLLVAQRGDPFQRLMAHPLSDAFEAEDLSRDSIPAYFSFLHLVLGDARDVMTRACDDILAEIKAEPFFTWDAFYDDLRSQQIFWTALARIAESFKRFDARRDWFIDLMQNRPHAVSLSANAFIPLTHGHVTEGPHPFGQPQFETLFRCLFHPLRNLAAPEKQAFMKLLGVPPEQHFKAIYQNLGG